jgi:quercetin dioxygenase-like cupin family protein
MFNRSKAFVVAALVVAAGAAATAGAADAPASRAGEARAIALGVNDPALKWGPCPPLFAPGCQIAVLQGDPAKPNADVFFRIPAGYVIAPHSHTSAEHMVLVTGELEVQYRGQEPVKLRTGDYAYGPPNLPHLGRCLSRTPCTLFIAFELPVDAVPYEGRMR